MHSNDNNDVQFTEHNCFHYADMLLKAIKRIVKTGQAEAKASLIELFSETGSKLCTEGQHTLNSSRQEIIKALDEAETILTGK